VIRIKSSAQEGKKEEKIESSQQHQHSFNLDQKEKTTVYHD